MIKLMGNYIYFNTGKTLEELEEVVEEKSSFESHLVVTCQALRQKRLCDFTQEDIRIMIGQQLSLPYLVPMALEILEDNIFERGNYYPGDLLKAVANIPKAFWKEHPPYKSDLTNCIEEQVKYLNGILQTLK